MGIGSDGGRTLLEQALDMPANEGAAVTAADELRIADRLIDAPGAGRQVGEMVAGPGMGVVILGVSERAAVQFDDPGAGVRIGHGLFEEGEVFFGRTPPSRPMRAPSPLAQEGQVGPADGPETIIMGHRRGLASAAAAREAESLA